MQSSDEIENASDSLFDISGKIGQHLRDNEWLMGIKQRACIPGGTCEFDLPSYHYWLHQDATLRRNYLNALAGSHVAHLRCLDIILKLLRESGKVHHFTAHQGSFQQMQGGRVAQLLRISSDSRPAMHPRSQRQQIRAQYPFRHRQLCGQKRLVRSGRGVQHLTFLRAK